MALGPGAYEHVYCNVGPSASPFGYKVIALG